MFGLVLRTTAGVLVGLGPLGFFASLPSTNTYELNSYGFGSGGTPNSTTGSYSLEGITGEASSQADSTSAYTLQPGYVQTQQANVPKVTLTNTGNAYDKLHFVIDQQNNPSDALYALRIQTTTTTCASPTATYYVKSDMTIGGSLSVADYQTFAAWGGAGGANIIGLSPSTTYCLSAKATQGKFTESAYGPASSAATVGQQISFCLYTNANCAAGGHTESLNLLSGTVSTSGNIGIDISTNADAGGSVYIYSTGSLSSSSHPGTPINSSSAGTTADLGSASKGYGAQIVTAISISKNPPFDQSGNVVGSLSPTIQTLLSAAAPFNSTGNQIQLQARSDNTIKPAGDYTDTVTVIAAASF